MSAAVLLALSTRVAISLNMQNLEGIVITGIGNKESNNFFCYSLFFSHNI